MKLTVEEIKSAASTLDIDITDLEVKQLILRADMHGDRAAQFTATDVRYSYLYAPIFDCCEDRKRAAVLTDVLLRAILVWDTYRVKNPKIGGK